MEADVEESGSRDINLDFVRELIALHSVAAREAVAELRAAFPAFTHPKLVLYVGIPFDGTLPSGRTFSFHGIGCWFRNGPGEVDVDFGDDGRDDGFDPWRLRLFARMQLNRELDQFALHDALDELVANGEIEKSGYVVGGGLYFPRTRHVMGPSYMLSIPGFDFYSRE